MSTLVLFGACSAYDAPVRVEPSRDDPTTPTHFDVGLRPGDLGPSPAAAPLNGCDLPDIERVDAPSFVSAESVRSALVVGEFGSYLGSAALITSDRVTGTSLVAGADGWNQFGPYSDTKRGAVWLLRAPMSGVLYWGDTDSILFGPDEERPGAVLASGDFDGDGTKDLFVGTWMPYASQWVVAAPVPDGLGELENIATAEFRRDLELGPWTVTTGDWNGDGIDDLGLGYDRFLPFPFPDAGLLVYQGPLSGKYRFSPFVDPLPDAAVAAHGLDEPDQTFYYSGMSSAMIPDVTGDGAADTLASGEYWTPEIAPYQGRSPGQQGGFALFDGNVPLGRDVDGARAVLYGVCDSGLWDPVPVGDLTGDGKPDVAVIGRSAMIGGSDRGAVYVLSELGSAAGTQSLSSVAGAVIAGHGPIGLAGGYFWAVAGLGDLNGDGFDDLAVSDASTVGHQRVYVFLGPLDGPIDVGEADLAITGDDPNDFMFGSGLAGGGDLDGDGVNDLVVNDYNALYNGPTSGAVHVLSGAAIVAAIEARR